MKIIVDSHAPKRGFFSMADPKIAAHMPRKKMMRVNPTLTAPFDKSKVFMSSGANWLQQ